MTLTLLLLVQLVVVVVMAALPNLTYTLHKSLYISLTSRSNTLSLPVTRGPQFLLPSHVVAALCRFRDVEHDTVQWKHWAMYLDTQDTPQVLPPPLERVASLPSLTGNDNHHHQQQQQQPPPLVSRILQEVQYELKSSASFYDSIVFAGEGEPMLRFPWLLEMAHQIAPHGLPMRLVTNGLLVDPPDQANHDPRDLVVQHCATATEQLLASGISSVSVAMMTANPDQYQTLMQPLLVSSSSDDSGNMPDYSTMTAHDRVCQFIQSAVQAGLNVETTGVHRPEVDKLQAEALASKLGVTNPFRWRPYFP